MNGASPNSGSIFSGESREWSVQANRNSCRTSCRGRLFIMPYEGAGNTLWSTWANACPMQNSGVTEAEKRAADKLESRGGSLLTRNDRKGNMGSIESLRSTATAEASASKEETMRSIARDCISPYNEFSFRPPRRDRASYLVSHMEVVHYQGVVGQGAPDKLPLLMLILIRTPMNLRGS
jgi:hypothetical protein